MGWARTRSHRQLVDTQFTRPFHVDFLNSKKVCFALIIHGHYSKNGSDLAK
jgi:hypothetical protein